MCPDKKLSWFNGGAATTAEQTVRQRWLETYEKLPSADETLQPHGSPFKVRTFAPVTRVVLKWNSGTVEVALKQSASSPTATELHL